MAHLHNQNGAARGADFRCGNLTGLSIRRRRGTYRQPRHLACRGRVQVLIGSRAGREAEPKSAVVTVLQPLPNVRPARYFCAPRSLLHALSTWGPGFYWHERRDVANDIKEYLAQGKLQAADFKSQRDVGAVKTSGVIDQAAQEWRDVTGLFQQEAVGIAQIARKPD